MKEKIMNYIRGHKPFVIAAASAVVAICILTGVLLALLLPAAPAQQDPQAGYDGLIYNGSFEINDGMSADGWYAYKGDKAGDWGDFNNYISLSTERAHSGQYSAKITLTDEDMPGKNPWVSYHLPVDPGVTYRVRAWVYIEELIDEKKADRSSARIKCEQYSDPYAFKTETALGDFSVTSEPRYTVGEWFMIEEEFSSTMECRGLAFFLRLMGMGTVYYDDFSVERVSDIKTLILETDGGVYYTDAIDGSDKIGTSTATTNVVVDNTGMEVSFKLLDGDNVLLSQEQKPIGDGVTFQYPLTLLEKTDTRYVVEATLHNADGSVAEVDTMPLFKYDRSPYVRADGTYMLDQDGDGVKEPFYPVFAYHAGGENHMPYMEEAGINTVQITYTSLSELDAKIKMLEENNLMGMISLYTGMVIAADPENRELNTQVLNKYKDHPNVLCWMVMDEPFSHYAYFDTIDLLADSYEFIRSIDKDDPNPIYTLDNSDGTFRWTTMYCDIIATDPYPSSTRDRATFVYDYITKLKAAADAQGGKAVWSCIQAFYLGYFPNNSEFRSSIYQSYFAGANAVGYYAISDGIYAGGKRQPLYKSDLWPSLIEYSLVDEEMVQKVFQTKEIEFFNEEEYADYWYKSWWKDGKLYLLLLNRDMDTSRYVRFNLQSADGTQTIGDYKATVIAGGVNYVTGNGSFAAVLPACGAQLWEIRTGDTYNDPDPEPRLVVDKEITGNQLMNSDFSDKTLNWTSSASGELAEASDTVFHGDGGYSIKLFADPEKMALESKYKNPWIGQSMDTIIGKTYRIKAWVKAETLSEGAYVILRTYDYTKEKYVSSDPLIRKATGEWVEIEYTFVATDKRTGIYVRCMDKVGGSVIYVDDVTCERITDGDVELILKNGDFETLRDGWTHDPAKGYYQNPSAKNWGVTGAWANDCVTIMYNSSIGSSLKLNNDGTLQRILARQQVTLEAGKQYTILGRIRVLDIEAGSAGGYELAGVNGVKWQVTEECRWTDFKQTFTVGSGDDLNPILNLYMDGVGTCYFDDLWLVEGDGSVLPGDVDPTKPVEVAVNGGFENDFKSWNSKYGTISQDVFCSGSQSAMIKNDGTLSQPWIYQQIKMEGGMTYTVSVRFRYGEMALGDSAQLRIRLRNGSKEYIKSYQISPDTVPGDGKWGTIEYTFTAPEDASDALIYLRLTGKNMVSTCYFDDFSVVKYIRDNNSAADNDLDNISVNGGFENDMKGWNATKEAGEIDTKVSCTGSQSLLIVNDGTFSQPWASQTVPLVAGKTYEFTVRYKGEFAAGDDAELRIRLRDANKEYIKSFHIKPTVVQNGSEWGTISYVFTAPEGTVDALTYLRLIGKNVNSKCWFDDFIVKLTDKKPTDGSETPVIPEDPTNLANNGSFETNKDWQMNPDYSGFSTEAFVSGAQSGKVFNDGTRNQPWMSQTIALEAGVNYKVTVRYKGSFAEGDNAELRIRLRDENKEYIKTYLVAPTTVQSGSSWGTIEYVFEAHEDVADALFYLRMTGKNVVSHCYFDDFAVRVTDEAPTVPDEPDTPTVPDDPTNLATNGSFETNKGWQMNPDYSGYASDAFVSGAQSGQVFNDGTRKQPWMSQTIALEAGVNYKVTVRYKGSFAEGDNAELRIRLRDEDKEYIKTHLVAPTTVQSSSSWGTIEYVFTAPDNTVDGLFYLRLTAENVISHCYFDDFAVRATDEAPTVPDEPDTPTVPDDPTNLATNGNAESTGGWNWQNGYSSYYEKTSNEDTNANGAKSVQVKGDGTKKNPWARQDVVLEVGKTYKVSVLYKGTFGADDGAEIRICNSINGSTPQLKLIKPTTEPVGDGWGVIEDTFTVPEGATKTLIYVRLSGAAVSTCYFDDFAVREAEPEPTNLATNGNAESTGGWNWQNGYSSYYEKTSNEDTNANGAKSVQVKGDGTKKNPWARQDVVLEVGKTYKVSVLYKGTFGADDGAEIRICNSINGSTPQLKLIKPTTEPVGDGWGVIEGTFTVPEGATKTLIYVRLSGTAVSTCYFDDFAVYEAENAG